MADEQKFADEIMSDEELDQVAGGTWDESVEDSLQFESYGVDIYKNGTDYHNILSSTIDEFRKYGVEAKFNIDGNANKYLINGKQISREEAWKHVKSQIQK